MRKLIFVCFAAGAACVPGNSPIRVTGAFPVDDMCQPQDNAQLVRGSLDVSGVGTYFIGFGLESEFDPGPSLQNASGTTLTTNGQNNWIADEMILSYSATPTISGFETERIGIYAVVKPGQPGTLKVNILGPKAAQRLRDNITDPLADPKTSLTVRIEFKGHLESTTTALGGVSSNIVTFPINVITTGAMCPNGIAPTAPCGGGGQDGFPIVCL